MTDVVVVTPIPSNTVVVNPPTGSTSASTVVDIGDATTGPQGPAGPAGANGAPGASGGFFTFTQASPASTWTIAHGLGYRPNISVVDSAGSQVEGNAVWTDINNLTITFSGAFSGVAYLS
jgi:hypothetical protein